MYFAGFDNNYCIFYTDSDLALGGKQAQSGYVVDMVKESKEHLRSLEIDVLSSKEKVLVKLDGKLVSYIHFYKIIFSLLRLFKRDATCTKGDKKLPKMKER